MFGVFIRLRGGYSHAIWMNKDSCPCRVALAVDGGQRCRRIRTASRKESRQQAAWLDRQEVDHECRWVSTLVMKGRMIAGELS